MGTFDRTLTVTGAVQLEVQNGSGSVQIRPGQSSQVKIHAEFSVWFWPWEDSNDRVKQIAANPPIEQRGNVVRVGYRSEFMNNLKVEYVIEVPAQTEIRAQQGSGSFDVSEVQGPASLHTGSGRVIARWIQADLDAQTGSGSIELSDIGGRVTSTTGSGSVTLMRIGGDVRASTGSGSIRVDQPAGRVNARTGSGRVEANGATADVRATTGSGGIYIQGNPTAGSYWELRASSGSISIDVPKDASFRLNAHSSSGRIESGLPVVLEQQMGRRELRGRVGTGAASVELQTSSGGIHIR
jgi:DUF4097 and DUF4098 domain-containing protein YvlB